MLPGFNLRLRVRQVIGDESRDSVGHFRRFLLRSRAFCLLFVLGVHVQSVQLVSSYTFLVLFTRCVFFQTAVRWVLRVLRQKNNGKKGFLHATT